MGKNLSDFKSQVADNFDEMFDPKTENQGFAKLVKLLVWTTITVGTIVVLWVIALIMWLTTKATF